MVYVALKVKSRAAGFTFRARKATRERETQTALGEELGNPFPSPQPSWLQVA